ERGDRGCPAAASRRRLGRCVRPPARSGDAARDRRGDRSQRCGNGRPSAAAAPRARGRNRRRGERVKLGIVSTADINRKVIPGAHASDKVELTAVASREQRRAEEYAKAWKIPRAYGSYEALLEDPDIDAVYISLPNTMHREWSIRSLEAGKHVICEKPFSRHPADVEEAFTAAERSGRLLTEAFMYRHNPQTARVAELIRE